MFPAVVHARRRNIRSPTRSVGDAVRRSPADGILPHSISPAKKSSIAEPQSAAATVGSSWILHCDEDASIRATTACAQSASSPVRSRQRGGHYGFNPTAHTSDRAVALAYRVKTHPFMKKDKASTDRLQTTLHTKKSSIHDTLVHVQGPYGHSVELNPSLVLNRSDIVQKYSNVTMQRGFQNSEAFNDLRLEHKLRNIQLPFPNPSSPLPSRLGMLTRLTHKASLQNIQYTDLYEPFQSLEIYGEFFLDSALPCAAITADGNPTIAAIDEIEKSHLEKVKELVKASASSLNTSSTAAACGPAMVLYCLTDPKQLGFLSSQHLGNVAIPAISSVLKLSSLCFVDFSQYGSNSICAVVDRMTPCESPTTIVVVDVNLVKQLDSNQDMDFLSSENEPSNLFKKIDDILATCIQAASRGCQIKVIFVLPYFMSDSHFLSKLPSIVDAKDDLVALCKSRFHQQNHDEDINDNMVVAVVPFLVSLMNILRSKHRDFNGNKANNCLSWWKNWDAENAVMKQITPIIMTAISNLGSRIPKGSQINLIQGSTEARSHSRSSLLSRGTTSSNRSSMERPRSQTLQCSIPALICTIPDSLNEEDAWDWFKIGIHQMLKEMALQKTSNNSDSDDQLLDPGILPLYATAVRFHNSETNVAAEELCEELIQSLMMQLAFKSKTQSDNYSFEALQLQLKEIMMCSECVERGLIVLLPYRSPSTLDCIHYSMNPVPPHITFIVVSSHCTTLQAQALLLPALTFDIEDVGTVQVEVNVAVEAATRIPACVNGHQTRRLQADPIAVEACDTTTITWNRVFDTRCATLIHRHFSRLNPTKTITPTKQMQMRLSSPYSPSSSPRCSTPPNGKTSGISLGKSNGASSIEPNLEISKDMMNHKALCCQSLSVACKVFGNRIVIAVIGTVLALPGIPLHLLSYVASSIARQLPRDTREVEQIMIPSRREFTTTAVCLAPFFFKTHVNDTELCYESKFPKLQQSFDALFGISRSTWRNLQQVASQSLLSIADPASDGTFIGMCKSGRWICENLLLVLLSSNCHQTSSEVACNLLKWQAVYLRLGMASTKELMKRCCGSIKYHLQKESSDPFKSRVLHHSLQNLQIVVEGIHISHHEQVGVLEALVICLWLNSNSNNHIAQLIQSALKRIASLQAKVLDIFKHSANTLNVSAPGCVWRLLHRANAAEWLSHKQLLGAIVSGNSDVDSLLLQVRKNAVLLQASAFVKRNTAPQEDEKKIERSEGTSDM